MRTALESLVEALESEPSRPLRALEVAPEAERRRLLYEWNATQAEYPREKLVHELFEEQVERTPESVAVVFEDAILSYGELNERANQLAHYLRESGVGPEERVALCLERGLEMVVAVLGVLKAGGAYVPLDPAYPVERLKYMLEDSAPVALLTQGHLQELFTNLREALPVVDLAKVEPLRKAQSGRNPKRVETGLMAEHPAYIIYTSGSTGTPKGVAIEHRNAVNLICWAQQAFAVDVLERTLFSTSLNFDLAVYECFVPMTVGATVKIVPNALELARQSVDVTLINTVPSAITALVEENKVPPTVRVVNLAGEPLKRALVERIFGNTEVEAVCNLYGPSETTTYSTWVAMKRGTPFAAHIGCPIANTKIYILNANHQPTPMGVAGELYIGGAGVARGYLNHPEITAERFLQDPFADEAEARMYRTGDLGRWLADGTIEFLGRNDFQVKIRGYRIELGEIEARMAEHEGVREAVVIAREDTVGDQRLVAYYTGAEANGSGKEGIGAEQLRQHLSASLPEYMVPAAYVRLERLPLTPNGKIDRKALPTPEGDSYVARGYEEPVGETERALAGIWAEALKLERVGRHDNFFELGGHSLLVVRVISRLRKVLNVELAISDVFAHPALADLARTIESAGQAELPPITPAQRGEDLPLSFAQQRLWFLAQMGASEAYHIFHGLRLKGRLDRKALRRALDRIVARHEELRTTFISVEGEPAQRITAPDESRFHLAERDLREQIGAREELNRLVREEAAAGFDLASGPLIRGRLIRMGEEEHALLITMHHIVSDGWSIGVFIRELSSLYSAFARGEEDPLPELGVQYADYAVWQRRWMEGEILRNQGEYWERTLAGAPSLLELPTDHPRPAEQDYAGGLVQVALNEELSRGLKELSKRRGTTLYMTVLAGWGALLARLSGQEDIVIGTPAANRGRVEIEGLIGFFVNTLAMRLDVSGSPSVAELLRRVKGQALGAQQHQDIPFEQVVEIAQPARSLAHTPLFQVLFDWQQNTGGGGLALSGLELGPLGSAASVVARFDLKLSLWNAGERIVGGLEYAAALFERSTVERYVGYLRALLEGMVAEETQAIDRLPMLPEEERRQVLYEWNATQAEYPAAGSRREKLVHELFEEQVEKTPEAVAVVFEDTSLSYGELNRRANRLAHYLRGLGVGPDARVGICLERSLEMVVGLLGVLKAGGAYVPLDPTYPAERLQYMVADSAPVAVLTRGQGPLLFSWGDGPAALDLGDEAPPWRVESESDPDPVRVGLRPESLAYVIYTSGSTGTAKGVMVEHRQLVNYVAAISEKLELEEGWAYGLASTFAADLGNTTLFPSLLRGGRLHALSSEESMDGDRFGRYCLERGIDCLKITPTHFQALLGEWGQGERIPRERLVFGGEALSRELVARVRSLRPECRIYNHYGPTECTVGALSEEAAQGGEMAGKGTVALGRPMGNMRVYVLDRQGNETPVGVVGEICIGGAGVTRGYLNRAELTGERFVSDPFAGDGNERMYKTGDLGRWLGDGTIEFLGRNDFQVKIRGYRIELGEIEACLAEREGVGEVVVIVREDTVGDRRLVAYYTGAEANGGGKEGIGAEQLRLHLSARLPEYMAPTAYVCLEKLPLTPNGKLDRKALPAPEGDAYGARNYEEPVGEIETALAGVWAELLKLERVGRHDNFFELGGHSLLVVRVISRLRKILNVEVAISDVFAHPALADLAHTIESAGQDTLPPITPAQRGEDLPLSFAQQRLWFLAQMGASEAYHIFHGLRLKGRLDREALRRALDRIVARHEALRTTFISVEGEPAQRITAPDESRFYLAERDLREQIGAREELDRLVREEAAAGFDLASGPLIRGRLIRMGEDEHALLITMHHIVSDGWSREVFIKELSSLYGAFARGEEDPLPELGVQYADYAVWQRKWMEGEVLRKQGEYWERTLAGAPSLLKLPTDHPRPAVQDYAGGRVQVALNEELSRGLKELSKRRGTTLYMTLLAGWGALMARLSEQEDLVIGGPVANRGRMEIEGLIGFFVNTLALRLDVSGSPSVVELLRRVKGQALEAQQHQDIPFEQVVEIVQPARSLAHTPLFQVMFAWQQNAGGGGLALPGLELGPLGSAAPVVAKFDLMLSLRDVGERIEGNLAYAAALFERSTVERYVEYLRALLEGMVAEETQAIDRLPMLSEAERRQLLYEWNATEAEYPRDKLVHELFEEQVEKTPETVAVVFEDTTLSYGELNRCANRLAHYLRELGVGPGARVGICLERSLEMVVGLLAVLKAGGAYVPLDPAYPPERLSYMLEDSAPTALLTDGHLQGGLKSVAAEYALIELGGEASFWNSYAEINLDSGRCGLTPEDLAYVIYTSGSTGKPKGVMVQHRGVVNRIELDAECLWSESG